MTIPEYIARVTKCYLKEVMDSSTNQAQTAFDALLEVATEWAVELGKYQDLNLQ